MIRAARYAAQFVGTLLVLGLGALSMFWLTRPSEEHVHELVVDPEIDHDDPGEDLDKDPS